MIFAWHRRVDFDLVVLKHHLISIVLFGTLTDQHWAISFVYSPCDQPTKDVFWKEVGQVRDLFGGRGL